MSDISDCGVVGQTGSTSNATASVWYTSRSVLHTLQLRLANGMVAKPTQYVMYILYRRLANLHFSNNRRIALLT